jgi:dihydrofolate reductase
MTATYTADVFSTVDGFGAPKPGTWGGYWDKQGAELLQEPLDWPDATLSKGDAVEVVARLKEESEVPLRSHGSVSMNRALMAAGLVDRLQLTIFPVITGQTGAHPIFQDAADFDLELVESRTFDGHIQELIYQPNLH